MCRAVVLVEGKKEVEVVNNIRTPFGYHHVLRKAELSLLFKNLGA